MTPVSDPILVEVLRNEIETVGEEMHIAILKTARSPMLKMGDFATGIADRRGRVIGHNMSSGFFVSSFTSVMHDVMARWSDDLHPGDVIVCNDPYRGGSHKPDVYVVVPLFHGDAHVGFALTYSHHADVGGRFAGGMSSHALNSFEEGLHLPTVKLFDAGVRNEALADVLRSNVRVGDDFLGEIDTKIAGCWRGGQEFERIIQRYGIEIIEACVERMLDEAEATARRMFASVPDGEYRGEVTLRDDGLGSADVALPVCATLTFSGGELVVDLAGTAEQVESAINLPLGNTHAMVRSTIHSLLSEDQALANVVPERVPVPAAGVDVFHVSGRRSDGSAYSTMDLLFGGWGARPDKDGVDGAAPNSFAGTATEMLERAAPVMVEEFGFVPDSAGPGRYRGGMSVVKTYRFLEDSTVMIRTMQPFERTPGMAGGQPGSVPVNVEFDPADGVQRELPAQSHVHLAVRAGQRIRHETGGLGGHGDPTTRDPAAISEDVATGRLSVEGARQQYGVSVDDEADRRSAPPSGHKVST